MQWTMRALDQKEEACGGSKRRPHSTGGMSPSREGSPKRCSPKRNGRHDSPPRNRHRFCNDNPSPPKRRDRCDWRHWATPRWIPAEPSVRRSHARNSLLSVAFVVSPSKQGIIEANWGEHRDRHRSNNQRVSTRSRYNSLEVTFSLMLNEVRIFILWNWLVVVVERQTVSGVCQPETILCPEELFCHCNGETRSDWVTRGCPLIPTLWPQYGTTALQAISFLLASFNQPLLLFFDKRTLPSPQWRAVWEAIIVNGGRGGCDAHHLNCPPLDRTQVSP